MGAPDQMGGVVCIHACETAGTILVNCAGQLFELFARQAGCEAQRWWPVVRELLTMIALTPCSNEHAIIPCRPRCTQAPGAH